MTVQRMAPHRAAWCILLLFCALLTGKAAVAQTLYGTIVGTVTANGALVPGATVTIKDLGTNTTRSAKANSAGDYQFVSLVPAVYSVVVEMPSFKRFVHDNVRVEVSTTTRVDAPLEVGAITETVEVSTETALLQTDSSTLSSKIEGQQVQEMPLNGRNVMNLLALAPGVIPTNSLEQQTGMNNGGGTNPSSWNGFTTNGGDNVEFMDGSPLNALAFSGGGGGLTLVPTQDAVQEFSADTSVGGADEGRATGGVINMVSKSGTNKIHGSVYEYFRNSALNANTYFGNLTHQPRPKWNQNQYGATIGFPILKDKLFFFGSWEAFKLLTAVATSTNVPTAAMQAGVFTRPIVDPLASSDGCVISHDASAGTYTLGSACLDPTSQVLKTYYPLPNAPSISPTAYYFNGPDTDMQNQLNVRADYNISEKQRIFGHGVWWNIQDSPYHPFPSVTKWNLGQESATFNNKLLILGDTYTVSPKTVVDVRASYLRFLFGAFSTPSNVDLSQFGPAYGALQPFIPAGNVWLPAPSFSAGVHGLYSINNIAGMQSHYDTYGLNGSVTRIIGRHSLRLGGEGRLLDVETGVSQFASANTTYGVNYSGVQNSGTGDEWADFLMGDPLTGTFGGGYPNSVYNYYQAYYGQDTFQVNQKLTLNLGLRWELPGGIAERKNSQTVMLPNTVDPFTGVKGTEGLVASSLYSPRTIEQVRHNLFAPRIGFAYRVDSNTVFRGGFGITYMSVDQDKGIGTSVVNAASSTFTNTTSPVRHTDNPFPNGITQPTHRSNLAFMIPYLGTSVTGPYPYISAPYIEQWNFAFSHQVGSSFQATIAYVGTHGVHLPAGGAINEIPASAYTVTTTNATTGAQVATAATGPYAGNNITYKVGSTGNVNNGTGTYCTPGAQCLSNWLIGQSLRPYSYYTNYSLNNQTYGNSHYNALQMQAQKRFKGAGEIGAAFTWAKTIGDNPSVGSGLTAGQDLYNHRADRTSSGAPMRLVANYVLPLPFGQNKRFLNYGGVAGKFISGWAINGITTFQHGSPLEIYESNGNPLSKTFGAGTIRSNYQQGCKKTISGSATSRLSQWFNTSCFSYPGDYSYGNESVYDPNLFGQGWHNWDLAALKNTQITERVAFQFRLESFNTFNRVQFANPITSRGSATFGTVTSQANNPRLIQLSGRFNF